MQMTTEKKTSEPTGTFVTGVEIDPEAWREQTIKELSLWLSDLKEKKTKYGDPVVDFPEDFGKEEITNPLDKIDLISKNLDKYLQGKELREAENDLKQVKQYSEQIKNLEKLVKSYGSDDDMPEEEDDDYFAFMTKPVVVPEIKETRNPFELTPGDQARLNEINRKLGISKEEIKAPTRSMDEIHTDLLKLYQDDN